MSTLWLRLDPRSLQGRLVNNELAKAEATLASVASFNTPRISSWIVRSAAKASIRFTSTMESMTVPGVLLLAWGREASRNDYILLLVNVQESGRSDENGTVTWFEVLDTHAYIEILQNEIYVINGASRDAAKSTIEILFLNLQDLVQFNEALQGALELRGAQESIEYIQDPEDSKQSNETNIMCANKSQLCTRFNTTIRRFSTSEMSKTKVEEWQNSTLAYLATHYQNKPLYESSGTYSSLPMDSSIIPSPPVVYPPKDSEKKNSRQWTAMIRGKSCSIPDITYDLMDIDICEREVGGFSVIRRGKFQGKLVAIKEIRCSSIRKFEYEEDRTVMKTSKRFRREIVMAMVCNKLKHPHLLEFLGVAVSEDIGACIVMPWMKNGDVFAFVRRGENSNVPRLPIIKGTLKGVSYLHHKGFKHGDLKALNVLMSDDMTPKIIDYGMSSSPCLGHDLSRSLQNAGNAQWMAYELLFGEPNDRTYASDIWAFGMFMIEVLTAELPFPGKTKADIILSVFKNELPARPSHKECSDELWDLICSCWERNPEKRITAERMLQDIYT